MGLKFVEVELFHKPLNEFYVASAVIEDEFIVETDLYKLLRIGKEISDGEYVNQIDVKPIQLFEAIGMLSFIGLDFAVVSTMLEEKGFTLENNIFEELSDMKNVYSKELKEVGKYK